MFSRLVTASECRFPERFRRTFREICKLENLKPLRLRYAPGTFVFITTRDALRGWYCRWFHAKGQRGVAASTSLRRGLHRAMLQRPSDEAFGRFFHSSDICAFDVCNVPPIDAAKIGVAQVGAIERRAREVRAAEIGGGEVRIVQSGIAEPGVVETAIAKICGSQVGITEIDRDQNRVANIGGIEVGAGQIRFFQMQSLQKRSRN